MTKSPFPSGPLSKPNQRQSLGLVDGQDMATQLLRLAEEVRTPLSTILDMTDILLAKNLAGAERHCVETIRQAADSLLRS